MAIPTPPQVSTSPDPKITTPVDVPIASVDLKNLHADTLPCLRMLIKHKYSSDTLRAFTDYKDVEHKLELSDITLMLSVSGLPKDLAPAQAALLLKDFNAEDGLTYKQFDTIIKG